MGNSLGGRKKTAKVMKINGDTTNLKTPVQAGEVVKDYPGHVLLESEAVKHFGIRAKPLETWENLKPKRLYFLVELPKFPEEKGPRRVRSGIQMSAKERLESLMLARRSVSDLSIMRPTSIALDEAAAGQTKLGADNGTGAMRVRMRLPKSEVAKLMMESKDGADAAEKIMDLCMASKEASGGGGREGSTGEGSARLQHQQLRWKGTTGHGRLVMKDSSKLREKRVGFLPVSEGEIQLAVAS